MKYVYQLLIIVMMPLLVVVLSTVTMAAIPSSTLTSAKPAVLSFEQWHNQQLVDAKNRLARASNEVTLYKANMLKSKKQLQIAIKSKREDSEKAQEQILDELEKEREQANQRLEMISGLGFDQYLDIYVLPRLSKRGFLRDISSQLSPESVAKLLQMLAKSRADNVPQAPNTVPNSGFLDDSFSKSTAKQRQIAVELIANPLKLLL